MARRRALGVVVVVVAAGCGGGNEDRTPSPSDSSARAPDPRCDVGGQRKVPLQPGNRAVVLACGEAPDGRLIEIRSFLDAGGPCLRILGLPRGPRQCGRTPSESIPPRPPVTADAIVRITPRSRLELYGEIRPAVRGVVVRFTLPSGARERRTAAITRVVDRDALSAAHIREPFGYFIAFVPGRARNVVARGRDRYGAPHGHVQYDGIVDSLHPTTFIARELRSTRR
ncbi:MAG: hypothetical protein ACRDQ2_12795 [Gaiellales bacterium]